MIYLLCGQNTVLNFERPFMKKISIAAAGLAMILTTSVLFAYAEPSGKIIPAQDDAVHYCRTHLSEEEQLLYDALLACALSEDPTAKGGEFQISHDPAGDEFKTMFHTCYNALLFDHPELFWLSVSSSSFRYSYRRLIMNEGGYSVSIQLSDSFPDKDEQMKALDSAAEEFLADIDLADSAPNVALAIHDKLIDLVSYDKEAASSLDKDLKAALDDDESHSGGIGTPATRADVIEKLIRTGYVDRKGKQLRSTDQGRSLIDVVAPKLKDVALTADMERRLSEVEHGQADASQVETEFRDLAARIPADAQTTVRQDHVQAKTRNTESFGGCPRCGKPVVKTGKVFQCSTNRREKQPDGTWRTTEGCGWRAWTTIAGKTITDTAMRRLLDGRKVSLKGFTSRKGGTFDAALIIDKDKGVAFDFNDNKERKKK